MELLRDFSKMDAASENLVTIQPKELRAPWISAGWRIAGLVNYANADGYVLNQVENQGMAINRRTTAVYSQGSSGLMEGVAVSQEIAFTLQRGTQQDSIRINASLDVARIGPALN